MTCQATDALIESIEQKVPKLPQELLDQCLETDKNRPYLHVYLKFGQKKVATLADCLDRCTNRWPGLFEGAGFCKIEHEYRIGHIVSSTPRWSLRKNLRDEAIEHATPKPIDPKTPEYLFEILNNSSRIDIDYLGLDNLSTVAK